MGTTMSKRIRELRKNLHITQKQLADNTGLSYNSIVGYENGKREPNSKAMAALEQYFNVSGGYLRGDTDEPSYSWEDRETMEAVKDSFDILSDKLTDAIRIGDDCTQKMAFDILVEFRHVLCMESSRKSDAMILLQETFAISTRFVDVCLNSVSSGAGDARIEKMKQTCTKNFVAALDNFEPTEQRQNDNVSYVNFDDALPDRKDIAVFFQPAAAGTGTFLDSDDYDMVDVPINPITIRASFGVRVSGDSMDPEYEDEDIVFVKQQPTLDSGLIGVFVLNGDAYIKKLMKIKNKYQLVSLNSKYKPIDIHANDEFRVVGKVIGKLEE